MLDPDFWRGQRIFITGHTGFKGGWLALWLQRMGADCIGLALPPHTEPNLFTLARVAEGMASHLQDIRAAAETLARLEQTQPEIVFHLAAQPLVRTSYREPLATFATNVLGTVHLLEAVRRTTSVRVVVCVTTDKVYVNREWAYPYREDDPLGARSLQRQ